MEWLKFIAGLNAYHRRYLFWLAGATLFLGLFVKLTMDLFEQGNLEKLDQLILLVVERLRLPQLNGMAVDITALGSPTVLTLLTALSCAFLWINRNKPAVAYLMINMVGAAVISGLVKNLIDRQRPRIIPPLVEVTGHAYPSGHTMGITSAMLGLAFLASSFLTSARHRLFLLAASGCLIGVVGLSRVYLGVHYPSDVASGVFLGTSWTLFVTALFIQQRKN